MKTIQVMKAKFGKKIVFLKEKSNLSKLQNKKLSGKLGTD